MDGDGEHRDRKLADQLLVMVKAYCLPLCALLVVTEGWATYAGSIQRAFREKVQSTGTRGRCQLQAWPEIVIGTVIKKTVHKHVSRSFGAWPKEPLSGPRNSWRSQQEASK